MKIETDTFTKIMLLLVVICLVAITYKYLKTAGGLTKVQAGISLAPISASLAPISLLPPAPPPLAPRKPAGFTAKA